VPQAVVKAPFWKCLPCGSGAASRGSLGDAEAGRADHEARWNAEAGCNDVIDDLWISPGVWLPGQKHMRRG
jgi:hypothetical protein